MFDEKRPTYLENIILRCKSEVNGFNDKCDWGKGRDSIAEDEVSTSR